MSTRLLSYITGILFVLSLVVYANENKRVFELVAGSYLVKGLDVNQLNSIHIVRNNKTLKLKRSGNQFVLTDRKMYPAKMDKINDLIYNVASLQVKEKVSDNLDDLERYSLSDKSASYKIELFNKDNKLLTSLLIGKRYKSKGHYVYKKDTDAIYLTQTPIFISSNDSDYIEKLIFKDFKEKKVTNLFLPDLVVEKDDEIKKYLNKLSSTELKAFYSLTEPIAQSLDFDKEIRLNLESNLVYNISLSKDKEKAFIKVNALLDQATPNKFVISQNDGQDKLQEIQNAISAQSEAQTANLKTGSWVYEIDPKKYDELLTL